MDAEQLAYVEKQQVLQNRLTALGYALEIANLNTEAVLVEPIVSSAVLDDATAILAWINGAPEGVTKN